MNGKIISIFTNKGGVGKTTSAVTIGNALAKKGIKTLIIDVDTQCNATEPLMGIDPSGNVLDMLTESKPIEECIHRIGFQVNLHCMPNVEDLAGMEPVLIQRGIAGFSVLKNKIQDYCTTNFDVTIIDNPPNFGIIVINSLFCSDLAIIPTEAGSTNSIKGLMRARKFISEMNKIRGDNSTTFKVLLTKLDLRTKIGKDHVDQVRDVFGDEVFKQHVPACVDFKYAEAMGQTIIKTSPKSAGARAYVAVANELIKFLELKRC